MYEFLIRVLADGLVIAIFVISMLAFAFKIPRKLWLSWSIRIVLAGLTAYVFAKIAGHFMPESQRPFQELGVAAGAAYLPNPGFPSDHMLFATFLTISVWFSTRSKALFYALAVMTLVMGVARVLALVHTPLDIIGGLLIGCTSILWYRRKPSVVVG